MTTLLITSARNKSIIGKVINFDESNNTCTIGKSKKVYSVNFSVHQPFKSEGNFKTVDAKINDLLRIELFDLSNTKSTGIAINRYEILS
jgi:hypothetical protein